MDSNKALELFARADALYRQGCYGEALTALRRLTEYFPEHKTLLYAMALCLEGLEQREEAIRLCDRLVEAFHYDKAIILKARLITKPDESSAAATRELAVPAWPERLDIAACATALAASAPVHPTKARHYWFSGLAVCSLVALFLLLVIFFAQADTTMPGASPTLFPGRLLSFMLCTAFLVSCVILGSCLLDEKQSIKTAVPLYLLSSFLILVPIAGWLPAAYLLRKHFGLEMQTILVLTGCVLGVCLFMAVSVSWLLNLNGFIDIYRELEAGYG